MDQRIITPVVAQYLMRVMHGQRPKLASKIYRNREFIGSFGGKLKF